MHCIYRVSLNSYAKSKYFSSDWLVVICLKNRTFAVYKTTHPENKELSSCCDLLEKSYLCGIQNNPDLLRNEIRRL